MYYSELFFKKDLYSITEDDVIEFFSQSVEETSILEFKSGNVSIEKIYSEVAALHNSQGGLLIIGSPKPQRDEKGKEFFDGELTMSSFKNKDWLYQKIYSKISPPPVNLKIHDVKCEKGIIQILDIPKSINPPHQCLDDGKYYIRFETETKFAPHGLIEALFNRRKEPLVDFEMIFENLNKSDVPFNIRIDVSNQNEIPVINLKYLFHFYNVNSVYSDYFKGNLVREDESQILRFLDRIIPNSGGVLVKGLKSHFKYGIIHINEPFIVFATVWADNMNLIKKVFIISPKEYMFDKIEIVESVFNDSLLRVNEILNEEDKTIDVNGFIMLKQKLDNLINS